MRWIALALLAAFALSSRADEVTPQEAAAIRTVIEAQLDAFQKDDAERAFSYASSAIRQQFGTPEAFMAMVRRAYPVVYRPQSVVFEPPERAGVEVVQPVLFTDGDGRAWIAIYPMQRDAKGRWRINGCQLGRLGGQET